LCGCQFPYGVASFLFELQNAAPHNMEKGRGTRVGLRLGDRDSLQATLIEFDDGDHMYHVFIVAAADPDRSMTHLFATVDLFMLSNVASGDIE